MNEMRLKRKNTKVSYTALYLDKKSRDIMQNMAINFLNKNDISFTPDEVERFSHHMTINMGFLKFNDISIGDKFSLIITGIGYDDELGVLAFSVKNDCPSSNKVKHITAYVRRGSKPFFSNKIKKWTRLSRKVELNGEVAIFKAGSDKPTPLYIDNNRLEAMLYGKNLIKTKKVVYILYEIDTREVLAYSFDFMRLLKDAALINDLSFDMRMMAKILDKHNMSIKTVKIELFKKIKKNGFYLV